MAVSEPLSGERIVVVGAGVGGLSSASFLSDAGADVTVLERHDRPGGLAGRIETEGFAFDTGPSWYLMPEVFERFFDHFDREPSDYYSLTRLDPNYRVFFTDGDQVDVPADPDEAREIFESYEEGAGETFEEYLDEAEYVYNVGMDRFVYVDRPRFRDWVDLDVVRSAPGMKLAKSMNEYVETYFDHPKLQQLVQYTLVFLGGSPYNTPALYTLMSHVDYNLGVYYPEGGFYSVIDGLTQLATEVGVDIQTGTDVTGIRPAATGLDIETDAGTRRADTVLANANPAHVERDLLPAQYREHDDGYWDDLTWAPSAYMLYLGVEGDLSEFDHHTLVLPTDWKPHFDAIFEDPAWPDDPAYYVNVPSLTDDTVAPEGHEAVVILVPIAPGLEDDEETRQAFRDQILEDIAENTGVDLRDRIVVEREASPSTFAGQFDAPGGTALGLAHTLRQTGPLRPGRRADLDGLYYVGGNTTPGIGVPMALLSGEHAADAVISDKTGPDSVLGRVSSMF